MYTISALNSMSQNNFITALGWIFEESPWVAQRAWQKRPFADTKLLYQSMIDVVREANDIEKTTLICKHPDLATKTKMTESSVKEQAGVGLDRLTPAEYEQFNALNQAYKTKFNFPFIVAVKNHTKKSILAAFAQRLNNTKEVEFQTVLAEIEKIAWFRIQEVVEND